MKERIKKFFEEYKDEIIVVSVTTATVGLLAAVCYAKAYHGEKIHFVAMDMNEDKSRAIVQIKKQNGTFHCAQLRKIG